MNEAIETFHPAWFTSTHAGPYFADDLDRIPGLPPHTELLDGRLAFRGRQDLFSYLAIDAIRSAIRREAPSCVFVAGEASANVDEAALGGVGQPGFVSAQAVLVVEALSFESGSRGREVSERLDVTTGIPHRWLVDDADGRIVVEVWKLSRLSGRYELVGRFDDYLEAEVPFPVVLDLWEVDPSRPPRLPRVP